ALDRDVGAPGVLALEQLAGGQRRAGRRQDPDLVYAPVGHQLGEGAREEQVADGNRHVTPRGGHDRRAAAAQGGAVEDVVVNERGGVDELDGRGGAHQPRVIVRRG